MIAPVRRPLRPKGAEHDQGLGLRAGTIAGEREHGHLALRWSACAPVRIRRRAGRRMRVAPHNHASARDGPSPRAVARNVAPGPRGAWGGVRSGTPAMSAAGAPWRAGHDAASTSGRSGASSAATGTYGLRAGTGRFAAYAIHSRYGTSASITLTPHSSVSAARHLGARADACEHDRSPLRLGAESRVRSGPAPARPRSSHSVRRVSPRRGGSV